MREERDDVMRDRAPSPTTGNPTIEGEDSGASEPTIVIEDEALRRGFTQLPNYLFQVRGLSHSAKLTYALILSYAWQKDYCFPGQESLAHDLEVSTRSVIEYLKELQSHGLIRIQRRGLGRTNVYHVLRYPPTPENAPSTPPSGAPSHQEVKKASHQGVKRASHPDTQRFAPQEMQGSARQEVRASSHNKDAAPAKQAPGEKDTPQQDPAAADSRKGRRKDQSASNASRPAQGILFSPGNEATMSARMARAALQAHGIRNERLLSELTADPAEVVMQIERLQDELARKAVANPAGWLVEAIRGRYRPGEEGLDGVVGAAEADRASDAASHPGGDAASHHEGGTADTSPQGQAWRSVCAELRGELTPENYGRWFAPAVAQSFSGNRLTVGVPDAFHLQWLDRRLRGAVERAAARVLGDVTITFVVSGRA